MSSHRDVSEPVELASLSQEQFTVFSHGALPGVSGRIKKSDFFDGGVKCVL